MNKRTIFLLVAFASLITLGTHFLFKPIKDNSQTTVSQEVQDLENNLASLKSAHFTDLKNLQVRNAHLSSKLETSKFVTQQGYAHVKQLEGKVKMLSTTQLKQDTICYVNNCFELQDKVNEYLHTNAYKDSLVIEQAQQFEKVIVIKDSLINCYESDYSILQQTTDTLIVLNEHLLQCNTQLEKSMKRMKQKGKIFTGGALLLAGLVTVTQLRSIN